MITSTTFRVTGILAVLVTLSHGVVHAHDPLKEKQPSPEIVANLSRLFARWDRSDSPGFALGIVRDGKLIYQRGYGMANLDEGVSISSKSVFQVWSVTKTFTTMCVALLLDQGKIALDDPVAKFVPELPDYNAPIRIRHLVQCTSGLHDYYITMQLAGRNWRDSWTGKDVLDLLSRRKNLADKPGEKFQYSNSDYFLLGLIIERASGRSLRQFAQENLFGPLGMKNTFFDDDPAAVVTNRAIGYERRPDGRYYRSMIQSNTVGAFDLKTTVEDLFLWDQNFYHNRLKEGPFLKAFLKQGHLDNRKVLEAFPAVAYRGLPRNWYTGGGPGYLAQILRFPEQKFSVILLCNLAEEKEWLAMTRNMKQIAELFLGDHLKPEPCIDPKWKDRIEPVRVTDADLRKKVGLYRGPRGLFQKLVVRDGRLYWVNPFHYSYALTPISPLRFRCLDSPIRFDLEFSKAKPDAAAAVKLINEDGTSAEWKPVKAVVPSRKQLDEYVGGYFCQELQVNYRFSIHQGKLVFQINNGSKQPITPMMQDVFIPEDRLKAEWIFTFIRGDGERVSGFTLDVSRVRGIRFWRCSE